MTLYRNQIKLHDRANTDYRGYNLMTYNPATIGLEDMDYWHPQFDPKPVVPFKPVSFYLTFSGHMFVATPLEQAGEWAVRRVIYGEGQDFLIGTFTVPVHEAPEVFLLDNVWHRVLEVQDADPEGWRNAWTAAQIEQSGYDVNH